MRTASICGGSFYISSPQPRSIEWWGFGNVWWQYRRALKIGGLGIRGEQRSNRGARCVEVSTQRCVRKGFLEQVSVRVVNCFVSMMIIWKWNLRTKRDRLSSGNGSNIACGLQICYCCSMKNRNAIAGKVVNTFECLPRVVRAILLPVPLLADVAIQK